MAEPSILLKADLRFSFESASGATAVDGTVTADGRTIEVFVSTPSAIAGSSSRPFAREFAKALADRGLRVVLRGPSGTVASLGAVRPSFLQRLVTRSRYIKLGGFREIRPLLAVSTKRQSKEKVAIFVPPPTLLPLSPTSLRRTRRQVTTTHDPRGGGKPRLMFSLGPHPMLGQQQRVEFLKPARTTIGSDPSNDIVVDGLAPTHAVVERTHDDEYVISHVGSAGSSTVAGIPAEQSLLRTGSRIELDTVTMTYFREEYADHGRPFGGRQGGEIGRQRPQQQPRARGKGPVGKPRTNRDPGEYF